MSISKLSTTNDLKMTYLYLMSYVQLFTGMCVTPNVGTRTCVCITNTCSSIRNLQGESQMSDLHSKYVLDKTSKFDILIRNIICFSDRFSGLSTFSLPTFSVITCKRLV